MSTKKQKEIFEKNKNWIMSKEDSAMNDLPEIQKFFKEYKSLGGKHNEEEYKKNLNIFFRITKNLYVFGDLEKEDGTIWEGRDECYQCWIGCIQSPKEAALYFNSVDNVHAYT